ncbi:MULTISPECIES: hypothetical protein [Prauserella salsuginis group]|uniref:Uncharacterized protein n=1 Tax=Prauserella salsuginis TaxID=387889 RepID=A0ABW6G180_9PSEU|nr:MULTISPECIES: hypothetical protein [Prauserella salsuginis group]MCR3722100.1 hypothetical protein [Prauserella flava]MCR3736097.1 hypothetical protein [Prauserella salsuginis]
MSNPTGPATALRALGVAADTYGPTINASRSPRDVEALGRVLAESLSDSRPQKLVVWSTCDDAVLAHVVAVRLGISVTRASEVEGILTFDEPFSPGTRVALVATQWAGRRLATLRRFVTGQGGEVVALGAVIASESLDAAGDVPATALVPAREAKEVVT